MDSDIICDGRRGRVVELRSSDTVSAGYILGESRITETLLLRKDLADFNEITYK